jgi:hypothetical protein
MKIVMTTRMRRRTIVAIALAAGLLASGACSRLKPLNPLRLIPHKSAPGPGADVVVASHSDPDTVRGALDAALLQNEVRLAKHPRNVSLLVSTCKQYTQYALWFVQADAEAARFEDRERARTLSERAFRLSERGKDFCWRALDKRFKHIAEDLKPEPDRALRHAKRGDVPLLYWSALSLHAAIAIGGVDHAELLSDAPMVRSLVDRALTLDETWNRGALHELMITIEGQSPDAAAYERARKHFDRAVQVQQGLSPGPYVALALVAAGQRNRAELERLLNEAIAIDPEKDPANRLFSLLSRQRARLLLAHAGAVISR